jgi:colanic acid/amylovoran biosynthesis protein
MRILAGSFCDHKKDCKNGEDGKGEPLKRILILDEFNSLNNGEMARVVSISNAIRMLRPNTEIAILSSSPEIDRKRYEKTQLKVIKRPWYRSSPSKLRTYFFFIVFSAVTLLGYVSLQVLGRRGKLHRYDMFLHITGDVINDRGLHVLLYHLYHILFGLTARSRIVICAESVGPFRSEFTASIVRILLNRVDLITVREKISRDWLKQIGVKKSNVLLTGDPAFLLEPTPVSSPDGCGKLLLGVSASPDLVPYFSKSFAENNQAKYQKYTELVAHSIDEFIERNNANALLIPHVTRPDSDDIRISKEIHSKVRRKDKVNLIENHYTADEIKGIISFCDVFVASRMHASIASVSLGIPTVVLAHTHKYQGVLANMMGPETLIDIKGHTYEELVSRLRLALDHAWKNRETIKKRFLENVQHMQDLALLNARLIVSLLNSKK